MRIIGIVSVVVGLVLIGAAVQADNSDRIFGRITTIDGDVYEGLIRWDKNEASWVDVLDGTKELSDSDSDRARDRKRSKRNRESSIEIFGITIAKSGADIYWGSSAQCAIRFGHIKRLEVIDDDRALIVFKSGNEVELTNSSTDLGDGIREIIIEDDYEGEIELLWEDIEEIEFSKTDGDLESNFGSRLYGTLTTRRGDEFTGYVCWDVDEVFTGDILDGEERSRSRKIQFAKIASIARYSSSGASVTLTNGDEMVLRGSNDVDDDNRGIIICDPAFGQVVVEWDEFDRVDFSSPSGRLSYDDFDGGRRLQGTVHTEDGESYSGVIRWDDDEEYTWETLDGSYRDIEFDIEFGQITRIERKSTRSSLVTVKDGRTFRLRDSNDVDADNRGIFVTTADGEEVEVEWDEFAFVEFDG